MSARGRERETETQISQTSLLLPPPSPRLLCLAGQGKQANWQLPVRRRLGVLLSLTNKIKFRSRSPTKPPRDRFIHTSLGMGRGKKWKSSELIVLMKPTRHKYEQAPTATPMHAHPSAGRMRCSPIQSNTPSPCRLGSITSEVKNHIPGAKHTFVAATTPQHVPPSAIRAQKPVRKTREVRAHQNGVETLPTLSHLQSVHHHTTDGQIYEIVNLFKPLQMCVSSAKM